MRVVQIDFVWQIKLILRKLALNDDAIFEAIFGSV
jgi:hypothetical protein